MVMHPERKGSAQPLCQEETSLLQLQTQTSVCPLCFEPHLLHTAKGFPYNSSVRIQKGQSSLTGSADWVQLPLLDI